jgi:hypothetical protein
MKLRGVRHRIVTQVKVLSPEISYYVEEAEAVHLSAGETLLTDRVRTGEHDGVLGHDKMPDGDNMN